MGSSYDRSVASQTHWIRIKNLCHSALAPCHSAIVVHLLVKAQLCPSYINTSADSQPKQRPMNGRITPECYWVRTSVSPQRSATLRLCHCNPLTGQSSDVPLYLGEQLCRREVAIISSVTESRFHLARFPRALAQNEAPTGSELMYYVKDVNAVLLSQI